MDKSLVLFHNPNFDLEKAYTTLSGHGLTLTLQSDLLIAQWHNGPILRISLDHGQHIQSEIAKLAQGTKYSSILSNFDAWFEIAFDDIEEVLDEINTLIEVQLTLQNATQGFLYNTWNKQLSPQDE